MAWYFNHLQRYVSFFSITLGVWMGESMKQEGLNSAGNLEALAA